MIKKISLYAGIAVLVVLAIVGGIWVHGLTPTVSSVEEGEAFTKAHNTMMAGMQDVTYSGDPDADFAMQMIPHHQGAVDAANVEQKYGTDTSVRIFAARVIAEQVPQIDQMNTWRKAHTLKPTADADAIRKAYVESGITMMNGMMSHGMGHTGNADVDFVRMMIPHHQGAVDMGQIELKYGSDPEMRKLAQDIIKDQLAEIAEMKKWKH